MGKKLIGIAVIAIMLFGIFGLTGCDNVNLADYKETKITELQAYADAKGEENYCMDGWDAICKAVTDGKTAISEATTKPAVDTAVDTAKAEIDGIEKESCEMKVQARQTYLDDYLKAEYPEAKIADVSFRPFLGIYDGSLVAIFYGGQYHGVFPDVEDSYELEGLRFAFSRGYPILVWNDGEICDLATAYERGLLTKENLITIQNLYYDINDGTEDEMEKQIRKDYLEKIDDSSIALESVYIFKSYGVYNGSRAVIMAIHGFEPPPSIDEIIVGGFEFFFNTGRHITIWKDGEFFSLQVAYNENLLTLENIETIYDLYNA